MKDYIVHNHKQLVDISTSLCRKKINNQNKAKIEAIFSEMKNNIQPLTGLDDNELPTNNQSNNQLNNEPNNQQINHITDKEESLNQINNNCGQDINHRKELGKLKELNLNNSTQNFSTKFIVNNLNKNCLSSKNSLTNHHTLVNYPTNEHSDQELLDEVSDESQSSAILMDNNKLNNPLINKTASNKPINKSKRNLEQQDENYNEEQSDTESMKRKRKKIDLNNKPIVYNHTDQHTDHHHNSTTINNNKKKDLKEVEEENNKEEDEDSSDSDSSSGSSSTSNSNSSSSDQEDDGILSEDESVSSSIKNSNLNETENSKNKNNSVKELENSLPDTSNKNSGNDNNTNSNNNNSNNSSTITVPQHQQPQRSWALSSFYNKLNNTDKLTNLKSPPVTKAQLKQTVNMINNTPTDKIKNSIDSAVKSSANDPTSSKITNNYYDSDDSSSSSSSSVYGSSSYKKRKNNTKSKTTGKSNDKTEISKRLKKSISPQTKDLSDIDKPQAPSSKKSSKFKDKKQFDKKSSKEQKTSKNSSNDKEKTKYSPPLIEKDIPNKISKYSKNELPKNLLVSIDISELDKKSSSSLKKESDKKSGKDYAKEIPIKKETDYKDKYRSDKSDKRSSSKSKNDKHSDKHSNKYDKYGDKYSDKFNDKTDKHNDKYVDKQDKKSKKSKDDKEERLSKESKKSKSKEGNSTQLDNKEPSKHKKSKKDSSKKEDKVDSARTTDKKEDRLKESIKNELFEKSKITESSSSKNKESTKSSSNKESISKDSKQSSSSSKETVKSNQEIDYQKEGKRWKHSADSEQDPLKQFCKYFESSIYFVQSVRQYECNESISEKVYKLYINALQFVKPALLNKFVNKLTKPRQLNSDEENKLTILSILGLKCLSLILFHLNKIMIKEMRSSEKYLRTHMSLISAESVDPNKPEQQVSIISNKIQMSLNFYSMMKKHVDHLSHYNESIECWQQSEHILETNLQKTDSTLKSFFKKLDDEHGQLSILTHIDEILKYARGGLKSLNIDYSI